MSSVMLRVGGALLLVGAILSILGVMMVPLAGAATGLPPVVLAAAALVLLAGGLLGILAYTKAARGDPGGAFLFGLVAALLPPVQVVLLVGAILCKVSPEAGSPASAAGAAA